MTGKMAYLSVFARQLHCKRYPNYVKSPKTGRFLVDFPTSTRILAVFHVFSPTLLGNCTVNTTKSTKSGRFLVDF